MNFMNILKSQAKSKSSVSIRGTASLEKVSDDKTTR